jgi:hypothetical protein
MSGLRRLRRAGASVVLAASLAGCGDDTTTATDPPTGPRTITFPGDYATLQQAIDAAGPGDTVQIAAGTYAIGTTLVLSGSDVKLVGAPASSMRVGPTSVLECTLAFPDANAILVQATSVTIENLEIRGVFRYGVTFMQGGGVLRGCRIEGGDEFSVYCPTALSDATIEGNLLIQPDRFGVACESGAAPLVERNTIIEAGDCGIFSYAASPDCRRNLVWGAANFGIACFQLPLPALSCNDVYGSVNGNWAGCSQGATDISEDPLFCGDGTYQLQPESPCAPAGGCGGIGAFGVCGGS